MKLSLSDRDRFGAHEGGTSPCAAPSRMLERAAASDATVLLEGETRHRQGGRRRGDPRRERPARTGPSSSSTAAGSRRICSRASSSATSAGRSRAPGRARGRLRAADGGTIFLDELGELPLELQPKLLRALERKQVRRVGSDQVRPRRRARRRRHQPRPAPRGERRRFRSDLYYRLAVIEVRMPAAARAARRLPLLVEACSATLGAAGTPAASRPGAGAPRRTSRGNWPGNVRELRNYLERCVALASSSPSAPTADDPTRRSPTSASRSRSPASAGPRIREALRRGAARPARRQRHRRRPGGRRRPDALLPPALAVRAESERYAAAFGELAPEGRAALRIARRRTRARCRRERTALSLTMSFSAISVQARGRRGSARATTSR